MVALITERYLIHAISYAGHHRREAIQYPEDSLRESVLNAITNKDYTSGYPIQISVYPDHLSVWNYGQLPEGWTESDALCGRRRTGSCHGCRGAYGSCAGACVA